MLAGPHRSCEQAQCAEYRPRTGVASAALAGPRPLNQSHNQLTSSVRPPLRLHLPKRRDASLSTPELKFETLSSDVGSRAGETVASSYRVPDCLVRPPPCRTEALGDRLGHAKDTHDRARCSMK